MSGTANLYADRKTVPSYEASRPDILGHIVGASRVLDVGCNRGAVVRDLKTRFPACRCWGIEINEDVLRDAIPDLEGGFTLDLDDTGALRGVLEGLSFDAIIAGDVLEHTWDPWKIIEALYEHLVPGGGIFVSLPNIAHWSVLGNLMRQRWPINERGIYDGTHRRFFMKNNLSALAPSGAKFRILQRNFRWFESRQGRLDKVLRVCLQSVPWVREYWTFQYVFLIQRPQG